MAAPAVERLLDLREQQGLTRTVTDRAALAKVATILQTRIQEAPDALAS